MEALMSNRSRVIAGLVYLTTTVLFANALWYFGSLFNPASETTYLTTMLQVAGVPALGAAVLVAATLALDHSRVIKVLLIVSQIGAAALGILPAFFAGDANIGAGLAMVVAVPLLVLIGVVTSAFASASRESVSRIF